MMVKGAPQDIFPVPGEWLQPGNDHLRAGPISQHLDHTCFALDIEPMRIVAAAQVLCPIQSNTFLRKQGIDHPLHPV